ncbi:MULTISPECIES: response regulator [Cohnella]|uniref:response regulator n=1 Tax=Cohnella TaxID=329857 RepID=UPI0009B9B4E7|nr:MULTISPECIES: response regulator [Cohnella]MBN2979911.1 response regulator [Cohnella algarum]
MNDTELYRLLIVDDEDTVVDSLADTIDWTKAGVSNVYKAYSGSEALEILKTNAIDIVMTDIRMPGISGLELIAKIRAGWKRIKCILLSGHAEFAYAQKAIAQDTFEYLLKPASDEDVVRTVGKAVDALRRERDESRSHERFAKTFREHLPLLRGELLNGLLQGREYLHGQLAEKTKSLRLDVRPDEPFALMVVRLEGKLAELDFYHSSLMEYAIQNMAEEVCDGWFRLWSCKDVHGYLTFMATLSDERRLEAAAESGAEEAFRQLQFAASQLQLNVNRYLKGTVSVIISGWGRFPQDVKRLYDENLLALRKRIGNQAELFIYASEETEPAPVRSLQRLYEPPLLQHLMESGNWDQAEAKLLSVCDELRANWSQSFEHFTEAYFYVYASFSSLAHKQGRSLAELIGPDLSGTAGLAPIRSLSSLRDWMLRAFGRLKMCIESEPRHEREDTVGKIKQFIQERLVEDVTLQTIADHLGVHPVHVSRLFKLETGENVSDFVLRLKMEKAVSLLADPALKNYEIALLLGYQNPNYFIKVFKKYYSVTPQDYRNANFMPSD